MRKSVLRVLVVRAKAGHRYAFVAFQKIVKILLDIIQCGWKPHLPIWGTYEQN